MYATGTGLACGAGLATLGAGLATLGLAPPTFFGVLRRQLRVRHPSARACGALPALLRALIQDGRELDHSVVGDLFHDRRLHPQHVRDELDEAFTRFLVLVEGLSVDLLVEAADAVVAVDDHVADLLDTR